MLNQKLPSFKKGFKFEIYPTKEQRVVLEQTFGCCRFVWNHFLDKANKDYEAYKLLRQKDPTAKVPCVSGYYFSALLTKLKQEDGKEWLNDVIRNALTNSVIHLGDAYSKFLRNKAKYPRFKSKRNRQSFTLTENYFKVVDKHFFIARCKTPIKVSWSRQLPSKPTNVVISKTPSGRYYASFTCEFTPTKTNGTGKIGIDLGLKHFIVTSDGHKVQNPKYIKTYEKQLKRAQQSLSRKKKGSSNRNKARLKVAKLHERIANCRNDFHHKLSRQLVNENQVIGIERLMVKNMVRNHKLAKAISDVGWSSFVNMIKYKTIWSQHTTVVVMDTFFPSSHLCHVDRVKLDRKLDLSERYWTCPVCMSVHDRDINAAINIRDEAIAEIAINYTSDFTGKVVLALAKH